MELLHEGRHTDVFRTRLDDGRRVIAKTLRGPYPLAEDREAFERELEITRRIQAPGVVEVVDVDEMDGLPRLLLEDFGGHSLAIAFRNARPEVALVLEIGLGITDALEAVHSAQIVHKDVNPSNVVWNAQNGRLALIDFGISSESEREAGWRGNQSLEGTLRYLAPEQTGRLSIGIDRRADYYSLGATLFELLTGGPVFEVDEPVALVHAHVAVAPRRPSDLVARVPECVSDVVLKLLSKRPEDRYQSASGIRFDLEQCQKVLSGTLQEAQFVLGSGDAGRDLQVPGTLYGRQSELRQLVSVVRMAAQGSGALALVTGPGGVGKTALVDGLWHELSTSRTRFARGKFDQFRRNEPYSALLALLRELARLLLTLPKSELDELRRRLGEEVGPALRVLEELVPELAHIFGRTAAVPALPAADAEVRLHRTVRAFLSTVATREQPLVLILDDLQWADAPSLRLLDALFEGDTGLHYMLLGTFRRDEVGPQHGLTTLMSRTHIAPRISRFDLSPLPTAAVRQLLGETLEPTEDSVAPLAEVAIAKTRGNPFYLRRFLKALADDEVVRFTDKGWSWNLDAVIAYPVSENVIDFMAEKIEAFAPETLEAMQAAAILGDQFSLDSVAELLDITKEQARTAFAAAVSEEMVFSARAREGGAFRFAHDRIRHAARSRVPGEQAERWHAKVGRRLKKNAAPVFDVAHHLNQAVALLSDTEKTELAELNRLAGERALASVAYQPALRFFDAGLALAPTTALRLGAAEAAYLSGAPERANREIDLVVESNQDPLEQAMALRIRMRLAVSLGRLGDAVDVGIEALQRIGVNVEGAPTLLSVGAELAATRLRLRGVPVASRANAAELHDPLQGMALELLAELAPPVYLARQDVLPLIGCAMARITAQHGVNALASYGYALYALVLSAIGDYDSAEQYADLAEALGERFPDDRMTARRAQLLQGFVRHWSAPADDCRAPLARGFELAVDTGDFVWGAFCAQMYIILSFLSGTSLAQVNEEARRYTAATVKLKQAHAVPTNECYVRAAANLIEGASPPDRLKNEDDLQRTLSSQENNTGLFNFYFVRLFLSVLFGREDSLDSAREAGRFLDAVPATYCVPSFLFLEVLAHTQNWSSLSARQKARAIARATAAQLRIRRWAARVPANHSAKRLLLEAEVARVMGRRLVALAHYDKAIAAARSQGNAMEEALCSELASRFQHTLGNERLARAYAREAAFAYGRWGAHAKVAAMHEADPTLATQYARPRSATTTTSSGSTQSGSRSTASAASGTRGHVDLDAAAVVKISHALSEHLKLDDLVRSLVNIALELSGGTRAVLVGKDGQIEAMVKAGEEPVRGGNPEVPSGVLNYVRRTQQDLLLHDAASEGLFTSDPVVRARSIRSLLCLPVVHQGTLRAMLYVDHDVLTNAFSARQLEMLRLLTAQAAISLENAGLYANLEQSLAAQVELTTAHSRFVPHQFLQALERDQITEVQLGDHVEKEMSILFSDIRGFTTIVENLSPAENIAFINRYLSFMEPAIINHRGFVDSYIGDAIMALFDGPSDDAVAAGVAMHKALYELNQRRLSEGLPEVDIGIGVNTGGLMLGTIGGSTNLKCGVIGDSVNLASRVESLTKYYGVPMLISEHTYEGMSDPERVACRHVERIVPVGTSEPVIIYEVIDADRRNGESKAKSLSRFNDAVAHYYAQEFEPAKSHFEAICDGDASDALARRYLERCVQHMKDGVPCDWDGVVRMKTKS